jgi:beta-lactam-binding protein with PASTA domain
VSAIRQTLTIFKRIAIVIGIAIAFSLGLVGAIYLSLRSSETRVPDIVGKDRNSAENAISDAGLNFRVRAMRATSEAKPDTVLIQLPHAGEIVKVGQTVAVDISRPGEGGETPSTSNTNSETSNSNQQESNSSGNTNANGNGNANKEKKKAANRNVNENANSNRPGNRNLNGNVNRLTNTGNANTPRANSTNSATPTRTNTNRGAGNSNTPRRPPITAPTP